MKFLNRSITGLGLTLTVPAPTHAQMMTPDKLVGTWAYVVFKAERERPEEHFWTFRADGTMTARTISYVRKKISTAVEPVSQWRLAGDSLQLGDENRKQYYKVVAQDQGKSFLMRSFKEGSDEFQCAPIKFERADTTKPRSMPIPPPLSTTLKETELVGTWLLSRSGRTGSRVDTLILRSDGTWTGQVSQERGPGGWRLFPGEYGDYFVLHAIESPNGRIYWSPTLRNGGEELVLQPVEMRPDARQCENRVPDIWKRATP